MRYWNGIVEEWLIIKFEKYNVVNLFSNKRITISIKKDVSNNKT